MKKGSWIVFKISVYVCMVFALLMLTVLAYTVVNEGRMSKSDWAFFLLLALVPLSQLIFQLLNARLLQYFLFNNLMPGYTYRIWHTIMLIINTVCVILYSYLVLLAITELSRSTFGIRRKYDFWQQFWLGIVTCNIILNLHTIIGSLKLRNYLRIQYKAAEDKWLRNLGNPDPSVL